MIKKLFKYLREKFNRPVISILKDIEDQNKNNFININSIVNNNLDKICEIRTSLDSSTDILKNSIDKIDNLYEQINTCKNEINEIKNLYEQINICKNEINEVKNKLYYNDVWVNQNIRKHLFEVAGHQTAEYIIKYMPKVKSFSQTLDILTYGLEKVTLKGLYLEFGVFSGKTINHISGLKSNETIYGFDSFEGLPETWRTGFEQGIFKTDLPKVNENVQLIKGWFDRSLPDFLKSHQEICAFIHIDCDLYSSTKCVFDLLKDRIKPGTIICFDEYFNYPDWQNGEYKAFQELISETGLKYEYIGYVEILEQVAVKIL